MNEIAIHRNRLQEENLKLQEDLKMFQKQCQVMTVFLFYNYCGINVGALITYRYTFKSGTGMPI